MSPNDVEMKLRNLLDILKSDKDCNLEIGGDSDSEIVSKHNTDTKGGDELNDSKNDDNSDDFIGKDGKMV